MTNRLLIVAAFLVLTTVAVARASKSESVPPREPLAAMPMSIAGWTGHDAGAFDEKVMRVLAVDDYVNRVYVAPDRRFAGLYIGYYRSQREGDTIHSPLNCLPGAGWEPVKKERVTIDGGSGPVLVNRFTIEKGLERQVVMYWYQSHGRIVASEYWGRAYMVLDALRLNRTDGALVRVIAPVDDRQADPEGTAERNAQEFAVKLLPLLSRYLPG